MRDESKDGFRPRYRVSPWKCANPYQGPEQSEVLCLGWEGLLEESKSHQALSHHQGLGRPSSSSARGREEGTAVCGLPALPVLDGRYRGGPEHRGSDPDFLFPGRKMCETPQGSSRNFHFVS